MISKQEAAELVRKYLRGRQFPGGVTFRVEDSHVFYGDGWVRVPIHPSHWPERRYPIYEEIGHLEEDIANGEGVNLFLFLGEPIASETAPAPT